jgi:hypothetical protein
MKTCIILALLCCFILPGLFARAAEEIVDPVFNFNAIFNDPLDVKVLSSREVKDEITQNVLVVVEEFEFTAEVLNGQPVRIYGILAYPKGGRDLPGVYWSQGGMYAAGDYWPKTWAGKGYFCMNITLPHDIYNSFTRFTTERPEDGNLAHLAMAQMRGITYMTQRPEVDKDRLGVGGSSYGGLFSSLIAGADPRIKCGMSFFTTGNHKLGTLYPQFTQLRTTDEVGIWSGTIDMAWRLKRKAVPFLWAVASNDHWHHLPAAVQTYKDSIGDKRLAIAPNWYHAFPENIDNELIDWFDVYLMKIRKPYNQPSAIEVKNIGGKLVASWTWTGDNPVKKAEVLIAYGRTRPWHDGWLYRYHFAIPAAIRGNAATAEIPVPEPGLEMLVYGNITDGRDVITSTVPIAVKADQTARVTPLKLNTALMSEFTPEEMLFFARHGEPIEGKVDTEQKHAGNESLRVEAGKTLALKLGHIPERSHKLSLWLRTDNPAKVKVAVTASKPAGWQSLIVSILRKEQPDDPTIADNDIVAPVYTAEFDAAAGWKQFTVDCPFDGMPVEGYTLTITGNAALWVDTIRFEPQWER